MAFKTLLFDVDDTLLDFQLAEKKALEQLFAMHDLPLTDEVFATYKTVNHQLWQAYEAGEKSADEVVNSRFGLLFQAFQRHVDSEALEKQYREYLNQGHDILGNSPAILEQLQPTHELYVVTNGLSQTQHQRLRDAKLISYFRQLFISEEIGYQKPKREFFDAVFQAIPGLVKEETLIIGDSLSSDILGGVQSGIQTAWLNPQGQPAALAIQPTFELRSLDELLDIV